MRLGCKEICDCYRDLILGHPKENRYFYDLEWNISMSFFFWMPGVPIQGNRPPQRNDFIELCSTWEKQLRPFISYDSTQSYKYDDYIEFFLKIINPLKPDILVINQGFWTYPELHDVNSPLLDRFINATNSIAAVRIWKTTTASQGSDSCRDEPEFLEKLKFGNFTIFDSYNFTKGLTHNDSAYWDWLHYNSFVYRELNIKFIDLIKNLSNKN